MKKLVVSACLMFVFFNVNAFGLTLFSEDFESDLSDWTGKSGGSHHGLLVEDPLDSTNQALTFTQVNSAGDIFTTQEAFSSSSGSYILSFDYLGTCNGTDCGGFVGYSYGLPDAHVWLGGTQDSYPGLVAFLPDTGEWEHVVIEFSTLDSFHLMLEDFSSSADRTPRNAYFDNILLTDQYGPDPIPEPSTMLLFGSGLISLFVIGKKRFFKK